MQVSVKKNEGIHCVLNIQVPSDDVDKKVLERIQQLARTAKLDGFRPGRVPESVIKKKYGKEVRSDAISSIISDKYIQAIKEQNLNAVDVKIKILNNKEGESLNFDVNIELFPKVLIKDLDKIVIEKPIVDIEDKQVEKMIDNLRKQLAEWKEVERKIKKYDRVTIDFSGYIDGKLSMEISATSFELIVGLNKTIPDFEDSIIHMKKYEEKTIHTKLPENYQREELKGKLVQFIIKIKKIQEEHLPNINKNFLQRLGMKIELEDFRNEIKKIMNIELNNAIKDVIRRQIFNQLVNMISFEVPESLIQREINFSRKNLIKHKGKVKVKREKLDEILDSKSYKKSIERSVKLSLILQKIVKDQKLEVKQKDIDEAIQEIALSYENHLDIFNHIKSDKKKLENIKNIALENKVITWIIERGKLLEKKEEFFNLIRKNSGVKEGRL